MREVFCLPVAWQPVPAGHALCFAISPHSPLALLSGHGALAAWTGGVPEAQMCVRVYGRRVSVVDVRVSVRVRVASAS